MQENASYCHVCFSKIKLRLFSHFSVILTYVKNEWLATNSQNAILNNFEEHCKSTHIKQKSLSQNIFKSYEVKILATHQTSQYFSLLQYLTAIQPVFI